MPYLNRIPTIPKLLSAVLIAALGWYASNLYRPLLPEGTSFGVFNELNAIIGFICGWRILGQRLGRGQLPPAHGSRIGNPTGDSRPTEDLLVIDNGDAGGYHV